MHLALYSYDTLLSCNGSVVCSVWLEGPKELVRSTAAVGRIRCPVPTGTIQDLQKYTPTSIGDDEIVAQ